MDLNKLPTNTALEVLQWCKKYNIDHKNLDPLLALLSTKRPSSEKNTKDPPKDSVNKSALPDYKALRLAKGKSLEEAAKEIDMSKITLRQIEKGKGNPRPFTYAKLDKYYGVE